MTMGLKYISDLFMEKAGKNRKSLEWWLPCGLSCLRSFAWTSSSSIGFMILPVVSYIAEEKILSCCK